MFELSLIRKYLHPRFKQISVSIVSLVSVIVIALVVWLTLVFLSVTHGMERKWTEKLIALSAPLQILPTTAYYDSDYYQIDGISYLSDYSFKTIEEKQKADLSYDPLTDEEPKPFWIPSNGKDLVKEVFESITKLKGYEGLSASDFEVSVSNARFRLLRSSNSCDLGQGANQQSFLTQITYLSSFDSHNRRLQKTILDPSLRDLTNIFSLLGSSGQNTQEDQPEKDTLISHAQFQKRLKTFFSHVKVESLKTGESGYLFHRDFFPKNGKIKALVIDSSTLLIPESLPKLLLLKKQYSGCETAQIDLSNNTVQIKNEQLPLSKFYLKLPEETNLPAKLVTSSLKNAIYPGHVRFYIDKEIQGYPFRGEVTFHNLEFGKAEFKTLFESLPKESPLWAHHVEQKDFNQLIIPEDEVVGEGVLLPKAFREQGMLAGDRGYLSYHTQTASSLQEMRIPIFVAGFYDPGLIPNGGKIILAPKKIVSNINAAIHVKDSLIGNGINVWFDNIKQADEIKKQIMDELKARGVAPFWDLKTYKEYEFSKDFLEQISSDKTIFSLVAVLIIIVACTNIISMLILLVHHKRREIGILEAMGSSKKSIALIFGGCGLAIGLLSSILGSLAAFFTLKNIHVLMNFISRIQGHEAFNPAFFGDALPTELNFEAFKFVMIATLIMSILAGLIPALKAMRLNTTEILRSEH